MLLGQQVPNAHRVKGLAVIDRKRNMSAQVTPVHLMNYEAFNERARPCPSAAPVTTRDTWST